MQLPSSPGAKDLEIRKMLLTGMEYSYGGRVLSVR